MTFTFDLLTLKLVCELHQRWGTFLPNLGTLGLWFLELFAMYATEGRMDGRTDRRTDGQKQRPFPTSGGIVNGLGCTICLFLQIDHQNMTEFCSRQTQTYALLSAFHYFRRHRVRSSLRLKRMTGRNCRCVAVQCTLTI